MNVQTKFENVKVKKGITKDGIIELLFNKWEFENNPENKVPNKINKKKLSNKVCLKKQIDESSESDEIEDESYTIDNEIEDGSDSFFNEDDDTDDPNMDMDKLPPNLKKNNSPKVASKLKKNNSPKVPSKKKKITHQKYQKN